MGDDDKYLSESEIASYLATIKVSEKCNAETELASAALIQDFCLRQWSGKPQVNGTLDWLAGALSAVLDDEDPLGAFGLMARPNHRPRSDGSKALDIAMWVACLVKRGVPHSSAVIQASEVFCTDESNIRRKLREANFMALVDEAEAARWEKYLVSIGRKVS